MKCMTCYFQITACDPIWFGISYAYVKWPVIFNLFHLTNWHSVRKGGLIILYMILICINRKCPFVCLLKGVCFIICSLLEHCRGIIMLVCIIFLCFYCLFFLFGCFLLLWGKEAIKKWMFLIKIVGFFFSFFKVYTAAINWIKIKVSWKQNNCSHQ